MISNLNSFIQFCIAYFFRKIVSKKRKAIYLTSIVITGTLVYNISFINTRFNEGIRFKEEIITFRPTNDFTKKHLFNYDEKTSISDLELRYLLGSIGFYHLIKDYVVIVTCLTIILLTKY